MTKSFMLDTVPVTAKDGSTKTMVLLDKNAEWLLKAAGGNNAQKGQLKRSKLVALLRSKVDGADPDAQEGDAPSTAPDPMEQLNPIGHQGPSPKKSKYQPARVRNGLREVEVPEVPLAAFPSSKATRTVTLLYKAPRQLWISSSDLEWLVRYVATEVAFGGVSTEVGKDEAVALQNCSVPGLHIRWSFEVADAWEALFVSGPHEGKTVVASIANLTPAKWEGIKALGHDLGAYTSATEPVRKHAMKIFLEEHCRTTLA